MNPFWSFMALSRTPTTSTRHMRLRDLDARMSSFLAEKETTRTSCADVLDKVKDQRDQTRRELAH